MADTSVTKTTELVALAKRINAEHEAVAEAATQGLQHAVQAGTLLLEAKSQVPHGEWLYWL